MPDMLAGKIALIVAAGMFFVCYRLFRAGYNIKT